jgi:N-acetylmuramoyl-L-alanine amidase
MGNRRLIIIGGLLLAACVAMPARARADGPKTRYERVLAEEDDLRLGRKPSPLSQIRHVVAAYEAVVRRYPGSGYSDNALWQAAELSLRAHRIYRSDVDRETAVRMLRWLVDEYPTSSLHDKAKGLLKQTRAGDTSVAAATKSAPAAAAAGGRDRDGVSDRLQTQERSGDRGRDRETARAVPASSSSTPVSPRTYDTVPMAPPGPVSIVSMPPPASAAPTSMASAATPTVTAAAVPAAMSSSARNSSELSAALARSESGRPVLLKNVKRTAVDDLVRVTLEFDGEVTYTQDRIEGPSRLFFDMKRTTTTPALQDATLTYADDSVRHIRLGRPRPDTTRLVIDLTGVDGYSVFALYNPYRLTVDLHRAKPQVTTLVAKNLDAKPERLSTRVASVAVTRDVEAERRIQPRPLPYPMADVAVSPRLVSTAITEDVEADRRLQPHPLPHPLARVPPAPRVAPRSVARAIAPMPLVPNRTLLPLTMLAARQVASARIAAAFVMTPKAAAAAAATTTGIATTGAATAAGVATAAVGGGNVTRNTATRSASSTGKRRLTEIASETPPPPPSPRKMAGAPVTDTVDAATSVVPGIPTTLAPPAPPSANNGGNYSIARQLGLGVSRIVIDPGHGGHDPGALGSKLNESEVVLDVALRLEKLLLNERNFDVVLTRRTDVFIPLEERTAIANREHADLFLSIHANSSRNKQAHGIETYHLNFASNPEAEAVAARENAGAAQTMNHLPEIVKAIALNNKLDESRDFAHMVQESMVGRLKAQNEGMRDLGVKQAPFVVLIGAGMPSVLAEIAFISNSGESNLLRTGAYRQKVAESLFDAVKKYQKTLKSVGTVASTVPLDDRD